jgi:long-subunit acyl-CoA synthetase (AMP-forming)
MLHNRPEFHIVDLAVMTLGATPFSIYPTLPPAQIEYVVRDAGARVAIVETALLESFRAARRQLAQLEHTVVVDGGGDDDTLALADVEGSNPAFDTEAAWRLITPDDTPDPHLHVGHHRRPRACN